MNYVTIAISSLVLIVFLINMFSTQFYRSREEGGRDYRDLFKELTKLNIKTAQIESNLESLFTSVDKISDRQLRLEKEIENIKKFIEDENSSRRIQLNLSHMESHRHAHLELPNKDNQTEE